MMIAHILTRWFVAEIVLSSFQNLISKSKYASIFFASILIDQKLYTWRAFFFNHSLDNNLFSSVFREYLFESIVLITPETITRDTLGVFEKVMAFPSKVWCNDVWIICIDSFNSRKPWMLKKLFELQFIIRDSWYLWWYKAFCPYFFG